MSNPTDPRQLPGADPHTGNRKIDPVTGYDTTGHDWGGITELNTAFPKVVIWALVLTFLYSVVAWILLPAWPTGRDYTRGLLGLDQSEEAIKGFNSLADRRQDWLSRFEGENFVALQSDATLMATAMPAAARLFADNCAACHGTNGQGGPGFPVLSDETWLWGGDTEEIATTIRHGINTEDPDTRYAEMPAFDWMERSDRLALAEFVSEMRGGVVDFESAAGTLFGELQFLPRRDRDGRSRNRRTLLHRRGGDLWPGPGNGDGNAPTRAPRGDAGLVGSPVRGRNQPPGALRGPAWPTRRRRTMRPAVQKRLAVGAALAAVLLFLGANAHLLTVALRSQPDCRETAGAMPARRSC